MEGQRRDGPCTTDADCETGTCEPVLVVTGAADSDDDGLADPFDNCPLASNIAQRDCDGDGIGDACDRLTDCSGFPTPTVMESATAANAAISAGTERETVDARLIQRCAVDEKLQGSARIRCAMSRRGNLQHVELG